jgi:hypothetical protein
MIEVKATPAAQELSRIKNSDRGADSTDLYCAMTDRSRYSRADSHSGFRPCSRD